MSYKVTAGDLTNIQIAQRDTVASILQNVAVILSTRRGTVPLYRAFGLPQDFVDKPVPVAKAMLISEVKEAVEEFEPRATVLGVSFAEDASRPGCIIPTVEVEINAE